MDEYPIHHRSTRQLTLELESHFKIINFIFDAIRKLILYLFILSFLLQANKIGLTPFFCHNGDHLTTPPPAHCGIPYQIDPKMGEFHTLLTILIYMLRSCLIAVRRHRNSS